VKKDRGAVAALAVLTLVMTYPLVFHLSDRVASDFRDPAYTMYALSWNVRSAGNGFSPFADANIFYPHKGTLFYGDILPVESIIAAPVLVLTGNPVLAYNILFLLTFFLAGLGMYALVKNLTASRNAAFLAGLIFAFFPYRFAHISHLEILVIGWMPLCFLFIQRFFVKPTFRNLFGMAAFYVLQVGSCAYYGEFLTLFAAFMLLFFAWKSGFWRLSRFWASMIAFGAMSGAALFPYFYAFSAIHKKMLFVRALWESEFYSAELQHYIAVPPFNAVWGWLTGRLGAQEWQLFPGLIPVFLALVWFLRRRAGLRPLSRRAVSGAKRKAYVLWDVSNALLFIFCLYLGIFGGFEVDAGLAKISAHNLKNPVLFLLLSLILRALFDGRIRRRVADFFQTATTAESFYLFLMIASWLLSLGPVIRLLGREIIGGPYLWLYNGVPGFKNLRVPSRFAVLTMIGLSVFAGWGVQSFLGRWKTARTRNSTAAVLGVLILVEFASLPLPLVSVPFKEGIPPIYAAVRKLPKDAALVELPMPVRDSEEHQEAPAVYYSIFHRQRIVNGYSGYAPPGYRVVREATEQFPSTETFALLEGIGVSHVLVHTGGTRPERGHEIVERLRHAYPRAELIAEAEGDYLYKLASPRNEKAAAAAAEEKPLLGDRTRWRASANKNGWLTGFAFDGNLRSGWSTGYPQQISDFFELDLGETVRMTKLELMLDTNPLDYPRSFRLDGSVDGATWTRLYEKSGFFPMLEKDMIEDFSKYVVPMGLGATAARYLRITLIASHEARHWSINEIRIQ